MIIFPISITNGFLIYRCSRVHVHPEISCVLLIPNMFASIGLSEGLQDEQEFDTNLEVTNYASFKLTAYQ